VCGGFHNLIRFNCAPFFASCCRHRVLTVTCLDACRCATYLTFDYPHSLSNYRLIVQPYVNVRCSACPVVVPCLISTYFNFFFSPDLSLKFHSSSFFPELSSTYVINILFFFFSSSPLLLDTPDSKFFSTLRNF
jgi:hypothetical protein